MIRAVLGREPAQVVGGAELIALFHDPIMGPNRHTYIDKVATP
jgi:hypothetical protein